MTGASPSQNLLAGHLPTLDGWRGVAVLMVIIFHASGAPFFTLGSLGVSIFFALSGLLICNRLLAEYDRRGGIDLRGFYVRRAFRILPPSFAFLAFLAAVGAPAMPGELGSCVLFWRNYFLHGVWYTGHFWSLAVEEHFYLLFPVMLALAGPRRGITVSIAAVSALVAWRFLDSHFPLPIERLRAIPQYYRTDCRLADLLFGAVAGLLAARTPSWLIRSAAAVGGLVLCAALFRRSVPWLAVSAFLPWLLLGTVLRPDGWIGRVLEWGPLAWLGRMSYSLYLWQQFFFAPPTVERPAGFGWVQEWQWKVAGLLACAAASHYLLERPLTRLGRYLAGRLRRMPTPQPSSPAIRERRAA
jgi:peptidoglycan/LPS O-acetylase OafA/YrhL